MKKQIAAILTSVLILGSLTGCSNETSDSDESSSQNVSTSSFENKNDNAAVSGITNGDFETGAVITKYTGSETEIVIPSEISGKTVESIGESAFKDCENITSVSISEGVTGIGSKAFSGCVSLKTITIPNSVSKIGSDVFENCKSLESITIPDSVYSIGHDIFCGCEKLQASFMGKTYSYDERWDLYNAINNRFDGNSTDDINIETVRQTHIYNGENVLDTKTVDIDFDGEEEILVLVSYANTRKFSVWKNKDGKLTRTADFGEGKVNWIDKISLSKGRIDDENVYLFSFSFSGENIMEAEVLSAIRKTADGFDVEHLLSCGTITYSDISEPFTKEFYRKGWSKYDLAMDGDFGDITKEEYDSLYKMYTSYK